MPNVNDFPRYFESYNWEDKHSLYGYPADAYPDFSWISSLEKRFAWLRANYAIRQTTSIYLIREMIQWGGSQNGILQRFDDGIGEVNLWEQVAEVIVNIGDPPIAIRTALNIPGIGLTYASKLLRFIDPESYGALDSRLRKALSDCLHDAIPRIFDGNLNSMVNGYVAFIQYLSFLRQEIENLNIVRPHCALIPAETRTNWRLADVEMALFQWAESDEP